MTMSSYRAAPRDGHLERVKRIFGCVRKFTHFKTRFRTEVPDLTAFDNSKSEDWRNAACGDTEEDVPEDAPPPLGTPVAMTHHFDANLMHNVVDGKAVTGCVHFINETPIMWHSKKQGTVETATHGAEFASARTCMEQIADLRNTLQCLGADPGPVGHVFGDNEAMINSSKFPHAQLKKRHDILSFHCVRSIIARRHPAINHLTSKSNVADVVSEHWSHNDVHSLLRPVFNHTGDAGTLHCDDEEWKDD